MGASAFMLLMTLSRCSVVKVQAADPHCCNDLKYTGKDGGCKCIHAVDDSVQMFCGQGASCRSTHGLLHHHYKH